MDWTDLWNWMGSVNKGFNLFIYYVCEITQFVICKKMHLMCDKFFTELCNEVVCFFSVVEYGETESIASFETKENVSTIPCGEIMIGIVIWVNIV